MVEVFLQRKPQYLKQTIYLVGSPICYFPEGSRAVLFANRWYSRPLSLCRLGNWGPKSKGLGQDDFSIWWLNWGSTYISWITFGQSSFHAITLFHWNAALVMLFSFVFWDVERCLPVWAGECLRSWREVLESPYPLPNPQYFQARLILTENIFNDFTMYFVSASSCLLALVERIRIGSSAKHFQRIQSQSRCHPIEM